MNRNSRGQAYMLWYLFYLAFAVLMLGTITGLGVHVYSVQSDSAELARELRAEYTIDSIYTQDPLSGAYTRIPSDVQARLHQLNPADETYAVRVRIANNTYYSNEQTFNTLVSQAGLRSELIRKTTQTDNQHIDTSVVIQT